LFAVHKGVHERLSFGAFHREVLSSYAF